MGDSNKAMPTARATGPSDLSPSGSSRSSVPIAGRLEAAIALACEFHKGQFDKGGQPYILHPLRVMLRMKDEDCRIAAVLHDTVEDCGLELGLIRHRFGERISDAVDALSRREGEPYMAFIDRCAENEIGRAVKLADVRDNLDLSRLGRKPTAKDKRRAGKYIAARSRLLAQAIETRSDETAQPVRSEG